MQNHEQRRFPRIPSANTILVKKVTGDIEEFARTRTIGPNGCGFLTDEALGVGSVVELLISVKHQVINATGRVVYQFPVEGRFEVGAEFVKISDEDRELLTALLSMPADS